MHREHHRWFSPRLGRDMNIEIYGHYGQPVVVFPTSGGDEREYAGQGMMDALGHHIEAGRVKFYCVNSVNNQSWYDKQAHPRHRSWLQSMYDAYIAHEVAPFVELALGDMAQRFVVRDEAAVDTVAAALGTLAGRVGLVPLEGPNPPAAVSSEPNPPAPFPKREGEEGIQPPSFSPPLLG